MKNNDLANLINSFFSSYLKNERKYSDNTYLGYLNVISQLINYLEKHIKKKDMK